MLRTDTSILKITALASLIWLSVANQVFAQATIDTAQHVNPNTKNSAAQQQKPYVILISLDGFRWDLSDKFNAKNLIRLREMGVKADYLKPSFPSLTFPNQ